MIAFYAIAVIGFLGAMSPGPDFAIVTKNALTQSRTAGYFTAFGISAGLLLHSIYCVIGLAVIIAQSVIAFRILHIVGAAYLIYLGIKNLTATVTTGNLVAQKQKGTISNARAFQQGFLVNALNPKCVLFLLTIFSTVIKPNVPFWIQSIYALELIVTGLVWFCTLTFLLTHPKIKAPISRFQTVVVKCLGLFLIGFGLTLLDFI